MNGIMEAQKPGLFQFYPLNHCHPLSKQNELNLTRTTTKLTVHQADPSLCRELLPSGPVIDLSIKLLSLVLSYNILLFLPCPSCLFIHMPQRPHLECCHG